MKKINVKPIWSILCQESSVDTNTNNVSLFKILEEIKFTIRMEDFDKLNNHPKFDPSKPIALPFASQLVILWKNLSSKSNFKFPMKLILKDPDKKIIQEILNKFEFKEGKERLRSMININGIPLTKSGEYTYSVMVKQNKDANFKEVSSIPIKIDIDFKKDLK